MAKKPRKTSGGASVETLLARVVREGKMRDAKRNSNSSLRKVSLFMNGRSQAVRLPKDFRFEGTHVFAKKDGNRVILSPEDDRMERLLALFGSSPDFPERDQGEPQVRPELDDLSNVSD